MPEIMTLLHHASIFLYWPVDQADIEHERTKLEHECRKTLTVSAIVPVKRHGIDCTKVTWEVV